MFVENLGNMDTPEVQKTFSIPDYAVFAGMLMISTTIGVYYAWKDRNMHSNKEFLTANRSLQLFPVAMSLLASFQSSVTILGYPAEMYLRGTQFWMVIFSGILAAVVAAEVFLPVYYKLSFTSINKYLRLRFGSDRVRIASSITFVLGTVPYMGVVLYGPALALSSVTPLSIPTSILLIGVICTFYTSIGGIKAVVWTDTVQVFLMFAGLIAVMIRGFSLAGGVGAAFQIARDGDRLEFFNVNIDPYSTSNLWNILFGMGIMWCGNYCCSQTEVQRYCNVQSERKARIALYINMVGMVMLLSLACLCGIALFAVYSRCDPLKLGLIKESDQLMPYFVMDTLSIYPGVPGLFVSCVFSASLSTLSSGYNALATVTWDDFISHSKLGKSLSDSQVKLVCKLIAATYGVISIGMAFLAGQVGSVLKAAIALAGALFGPLFGLYILGILCPFANAVGVTVGLLAGQTFTIWTLVGSLLYPGSPVQKPTYIDSCPIEKQYYVGLANVSLSSSHSLPNFENEHTGILALYHIAFLLVPISGFVISLVVGTVMSLLTGGCQNIKTMNPNFLSPLVWYIWPSRFVPNQRRSECDIFDRTSTHSTEKIANLSNAETSNLTTNTERKGQKSSLGGGSVVTRV